jgi:pimeloyl-ACP methyl ester carboxylesterase
MEQNAYQLILTDGRVLEYYLFGAPNGRPVVYHHGMPGSAVEAAALNTVFLEHGLKVICPNRPGVGNSTCLAHYSLKQITQDFEALMDHLECTNVTVIGWSSGGVPALWQAKLDTRHISHAILLSSYSHFAEANTSNTGFSGQPLWLKQCTTLFPFLSQWMFNATGWLASYLPSLYFKLMTFQCPEQDQEILNKQPLSSNILLEAQRMSFRQSASCLFHDLVSQFKQWPFLLNSIQCKVTVFQGECDPFVPEEIGKHLADSLPNAEYHLLSGQGHLYWLDKSFQYRLAHLCQIWAYE